MSESQSLQVQGQDNSITSLSAEQKMVQALAGELHSGRQLDVIRSDMAAMRRDFSRLVENIDGLNKSLGDFRDKLVVPLKDELAHLRYNMGARVSQTVTNLDVYVAKLDKVIWGMLRAQGLSDDQIRAFRTENGMSPETPTGPELEMHTRYVEGLKDQVAALVTQNERLLAQAAGHPFLEGETAYVYRPECACAVCTAYVAELAAAAREALGG